MMIIIKIKIKIKILYSLLFLLSVDFYFCIEIIIPKENLNYFLQKQNISKYN